MALVENHGYVLSPLTVAPVNEADMVLLLPGLKALKHVAREAGLEVTGAAKHDQQVTVLNVLGSMCVLRAEQKPIDPEVAGLFLGERAVIIRRTHGAHQRDAIRAAEMIPLPATAVKSEGVAAVFLSQRVQSLGDFRQRGVPADRVKAAIRATAERRGQTISMVLVEVEAVGFLTEVPVRARCALSPRTRTISRPSVLTSIPQLM